MKILICNAGSTSLKFKLWEMPELKVLADGKVERVGSKDAIYHFNAASRQVKLTGLDIPDYTAGIRRFLDDLSEAVAPLTTVEAVGFKTVLSKDHYGVHFLTEDVKDGMRAYFPVAPAHNGPYLEAIGVFEKLLPDVPRVGVFETAFHRTIPIERRVFPVPYEWYEKYGCMRMGYHGASHGYIAKKLAGRRRVISCHLGGSGSLCAILDGKSVDNSFGFSLQMGIPHASRTGDVDVYLVPYLLKQGLTMEEIYDGLGKNGGLKGISGTSGDLRDIDAAIRAGSERAKLALDVYVNAILRYIGAYYMELQGLDAIAFTGGIGENYAPLRRRVLEGMAHMGMVIDAENNENGSGERLISAPTSKIEAHVIPANEELMVVNETYRLCAQNK
ncbi:MAG: acetate/propionate family kinase [Clostridia bacterium]|nr:acetate/propionate family kinase [Clostridia bacterium]